MIPSAGLLDTSVVLDLDHPDVIAALPETCAVSALVLAELASGLPAATDPEERARRQFRLQMAEATFDPIPFDDAAARCYGLLVAAVAGDGRTHRRRIVDLLIAASAMSRGLDLYTRNPADLTGLESLVTVVTV